MNDDILAAIVGALTGILIGVIIPTLFHAALWKIEFGSLRGFRVPSVKDIVRFVMGRLP